MNSNGTGGFGDATKLIGRIGPLIGIGLVFCVLAIAVLSKAGCANHHTLPGFEGYIRSKPLLGAGEYLSIQKGPTSTGWVWRQNVVNIDMRPQTYSENMSIRTAKGSELEFKAHVRVRVREGGSKQVVEKLGGPNWYKLNVQKTFQSAVREKVQVLEPFQVKAESVNIAKDVLAHMQGKFTDAPIEFLSVDIGNIQYPDTIVKSVIKKFVTAEENQRKDIELQIAEKQIAITIAEAQGTADAQRVIGKTLDPLLLQYEALRAIEQLSGSRNTTFLLMPMTEQGASPVILNLNQTPADQGGARPSADADKRPQRRPDNAGDKTAKEGAKK